MSSYLHFVRVKGWLVAGLVAWSGAVFSHGSFECLTELETTAFVFAQCMQVDGDCTDQYRVVQVQAQRCREEGFSQRAMEQSLNLGYSRVPRGGFMTHQSAAAVAARPLTPEGNWQRFRQTFGGFFDHDSTLLKHGFASQRCGDEVEGGAERVHWVGRIEYDRDDDRQPAYRWDYFEKVEPHQCYTGESDQLLVANIPAPFLRFYTQVLTPSYPHQLAVQCDSRDHCQSMMDGKNRQLFRFRMLGASIAHWKDCGRQPQQAHCSTMNWREKVASLSQQREQVWASVQQRGAVMVSHFQNGGDAVEAE